jgi:hypothetical protein
MGNFPTEPVPHLGTEDSTNYLVIRSQFDGNYQQTRLGATKGRKVFKLKYDKLTLQEFSVLEVFHSANIGGTFLFTHPISLITYTVVFQEDTLTKSWDAYDIVSTTIILEEV